MFLPCKNLYSNQKGLQTTSELKASSPLTLSRLSQEAAAKACIRIQTLVRGTLARWELPLLRLQRKREAIEAAKQRQLKKLAQRQKQKMLAFRVQMEHEHEHRVKMRHLKRANTLIELFKGQQAREEQEGTRMYQQIQELERLNNDAEASISNLQRKTEALKTEVAFLEASREELQCRLGEYELAVQIWRKQVESLTTDAMNEDSP